MNGNVGGWWGGGGVMQIQCLFLKFSRENTKRGKKRIAMQLTTFAVKTPYTEKIFFLCNDFKVRTSRDSKPCTTTDL